MYFVVSYRSGNPAGFLHYSTVLHIVRNGEHFCLCMIFSISLLGYFLNQTDNYFLLNVVSWKSNSTGGFRKNISGLSLFFKGKYILSFSECHESQRTVLMVARHCHGWQCHCWLQAWWIPAALEIPQCLSHSHPSVLQAGLLGTWDWGQHRAPCLHVCYTWALPAGLFLCLYCSCLQLGIMFGSWVLIFGCFFF